MRINLRIVADMTPEQTLADLREHLARWWLAQMPDVKIESWIDDRRFDFDMLLMATDCCTCSRPMVRGELMRCRPIEDSKFNACKAQCAECATAEALPLWDAEHPHA